MDKSELLSKLSKLPAKTDRKLMSSTIAGLKAEQAGGGFAMTGDPLQLIEGKRVRSWIKGPHYVQIPDPDVNLLKTNVVRRKLLSFNPKNEKFRKSVNKDLSGGESYPILTTFLGISVGFVSGGAGLVWTGITTAVSLANDPQPVRVRDGDEVHQIEIVGVRNGKIEHLEWLILIDPFRVKANRNIKQWIIHDERREVHLE
ncbi:hypothetical protein [Candidatus Nitrospira salsa]